MKYRTTKSDALMDMLTKERNKKDLIKRTYTGTWAFVIAAVIVTNYVTLSVGAFVYGLIALILATAAGFRLKRPIEWSFEKFASKAESGHSYIWAYTLFGTGKVASNLVVPAIYLMFVYVPERGLRILDSFTRSFWETAIEILGLSKFNDFDNAASAIVETQSFLGFTVFQWHAIETVLIGSLGLVLYWVITTSNSSKY